MVHPSSMKKRKNSWLAPPQFSEEHIIASVQMTSSVGDSTLYIRKFPLRRVDSHQWCLPLLLGQSDDSTLYKRQRISMVPSGRLDGPEMVDAIECLPNLEALFCPIGRGDYLMEPFQNVNFWLSNLTTLHLAKCRPSLEEFISLCTRCPLLQIVGIAGFSSTCTYPDTKLKTAAVALSNLCDIKVLIFAEEEGYAMHESPSSSIVQSLLEYITEVSFASGGIKMSLKELHLHNTLVSYTTLAEFLQCSASVEVKKVKITGRYRCCQSLDDGIRAIQWKKRIEAIPIQATGTEMIPRAKLSLYTSLPNIPLSFLESIGWAIGKVTYLQTHCNENRNDAVIAAIDKGYLRRLTRLIFIRCCDRPCEKCTNNFSTLQDAVIKRDESIKLTRKIASRYQACK